MMVSLLEMSQHGETDADAWKRGIDSIFDSGCFKTSEYQTKLVSATLDGVSVNFGICLGLLTQMFIEHNRLLKILCANHPIEFVLKDKVKVAAFEEVDNFYNLLYFLFKNSGKTKSEIKEASNSLNIQHFTFPKLTGMRYVGHRCNAKSKLLKIFPCC